ncbi:hypothetical protein [Cerasicoccus maritimus]|uniref:hypothetical protein n=1 Tax=Cerasicoccus maritimus TaxID=490089 RepID=UPI002852A607|nr:hypothetical protein [Cerasicoccus maritimus]
MTFRLKEAEWKELRNEAISLSQESRKLELVAVAGTGGVYAWLATNNLGNLQSAAWFIPVLFSLAGSLRAWAINKNIGVISKYLLTVESELSDNEGWEAFFKPRRGHLFGSAVTFWILFILITFTVPIAVISCAEQAKIETQRICPELE